MIEGNLITTIPEGIISNLTKIIGALGGIIFLYLIFGILNFILNKRRFKEIKKINRTLNEIKKILEKKKN